MICSLVSECRALQNRILCAGALHALTAQRSPAAALVAFAVHHCCDVSARLAPAACYSLRGRRCVRRIGILSLCCLHIY